MGHGLPDAKFGSFDQTDVKGHLETYGSGVRTLAAIAQLGPHVLLGDLVKAYRRKPCGPRRRPCRPACSRPDQRPGASRPVLGDGTPPT